MKEQETKLNDVSRGQMGIFEERNENEVFGIYPMMPRGYSAVERAKLREFERRLLTGSEDKNAKPKINIEDDIER